MDSRLERIIDGMHTSHVTGYQNTCEGLHRGVEIRIRYNAQPSQALFASVRGGDFVKTPIDIAPGLYHPCILMGARGGIMVNASKVKVTLSGSCAQDANKRRKVTLADMLDCIKDGSPWYCHNQ